METLDASGLKCPLPVLKAKKALKSVTPGEDLTVIATDPGAVEDFVTFCATTGDVLVSSKADDGVFTFVIRKYS
jgi:tRNA 2-thiouridine synthesizing protein A